MAGVQLELFTKFFTLETGESNTLELFDFCTPFINGKNVYTQEKLPIDEMGFSHRDNNYLRQITPAHLKKGNDTFEYYPSKREEIVMYALRYLAAQQQIQCQIDKDEDLVTIGFTLHQLRNELKRTGHGYNWREISEAIEILSKASLSVGFDAGKRQFEWSGTYLSNVRSIDKTGNIATGESCRIVTLHPIISKAILSASVRLINYDRDMRLKLPLSKLIYRRFIHFCRNAQAASFAQKARGMKITVAEAFSQAGLKRNKRLADDVRTMGRAIKELVENDILERGTMGFPTYERIKDVYILYPSKTLVHEIVKGHKKQEKMDIAKAFLPPVNNKAGKS